MQENFNGIRIAVSMVLIFALAFLGMGRVTSLCINNENSNVNTVSVVIESGRGDFYYSNGGKITGNKKYFANVFLPQKNAKSIFYENATETEKVIGDKAFLNNKPAILKRNIKINGTGVYSFEISDRYTNINSLEHLIGYINGENIGVSGLEKGYEEVLKAKNSVTADFFVDATGEYLIGAQPTVNKEINSSKVYLTINSDIQSSVKAAALKINKGAVVVSEISTGKIRGIISKPGYDINNLDMYLNANNSPFLNRSLSCYNVGSVFKPVIAAAILENHKENFTVNCTGNTNISGISFHCYNRKGHGIMSLGSAIRESCNCYFYSGVGLIEPKSILSLANSLMFSSPINIANNLSAKGGNLPTYKVLENPAAAANFSIGQGDILLSPLVMINLYSAIANEGVYYAPTLIEGVYTNGKYKKENTAAETYVFSKSTAAVLKEYLSNVVSHGTGENAMPEKGKAGGKTATAQTGKTGIDGEIINSWFCGFFPLENPKYSVTVFLEDSKNSAINAAEVFKLIADKVNTL